MPCKRLKKWAKMGKIGSFCLFKNAWDVRKSSSNINCELRTSRTCVHQSKVEPGSLDRPLEFWTDSTRYNPQNISGINWGLSKRNEKSNDNIYFYFFDGFEL